MNEIYFIYLCSESLAYKFVPVYFSIFSMRKAKKNIIVFLRNRCTCIVKKGQELS